jgi:hypothetical protein
VALFRALMLLLLVASAVSFVFYAATGQVRFRVLGLRVLIGALVAGFVFFAVLIAERIA